MSQLSWLLRQQVICIKPTPYRRSFGYLTSFDPQLLTPGLPLSIVSSSSILASIRSADIVKSNEPANRNVHSARVEKESISTVPKPTNNRFARRRVSHLLDIPQQGRSGGNGQSSRKSVLTEALRLAGQGWSIKKSSWDIEQSYSEILLAKHIRWRQLGNSEGVKNTTEVELDKKLLALDDPDTLTRMERKGYTTKNIDSWLWILSSPSADGAVQRLEELKIRALDAHSKVPWIVILQMLRAHRLDPVSLCKLLDYTWDRYRSELRAGSDPGKHASPKTNVPQDVISINANLSMALVVLFIDQSRQVLPEAMDRTADFACYAFRTPVPTPRDQSNSTPQAARYLSKCFNRIIWLLGLPCAENPYQSIAIQQKAQFRVLERMTEFNPHIPITRKGFHGMLRTQIAHTKTLSEKEWADYKVITWPPWKRDKTGLDVGRVFEGSVSRGRQVLQRFVESGYELEAWEKMAMILSGWDVDGSPTIQTRQILPPPKARSSGSLAWSRILSTRTLKEAWACFLEYEIDMRSSTRTEMPSTAPYEAMLQRLVAPEAASSSSSLPGDGQERYPEPTSPHDFFYVPEDPPTPYELVERMGKAGIDPSDRIIQLLINHERNLHSVINLFKAYPRLTPLIPTLIRVEQYDPETFSLQAREVPMPIRLAYVKLLVRLDLPAKEFRNMRYQIDVAVSCRDKTRDQTTRDKHLVKTSGLNSYEINNLSSPEYARCILKLGRTRHQAAWLSVLKSSAQDLRMLDNDPNTFVMNDDAWTRLKQIVSDMDELGLITNTRVIEVICDGLCDFLPASRSLEGLSCDQVTAQCLDLIKPLFSRIVSGSPEFSQLASSKSNLAIPSPYSLLSFVRVLGLTGEYQAMVDLLQWMAIRPHLLDMRARQMSNGRAMLRNVLVTMRVSLERLWADDDFLRGQPPSNSAGRGQSESEALLQDRAKDLVEGVLEWNGWPTDDEARRSCWTPPGSYDWKMRLRRFSREEEKEEEGEEQLVSLEQNV